MVKIAGGKAGSVARLKKDMEKSQGGKTWIRGPKAGEDLTVRFLTEPDGWYSYREHYHPEIHFFPCIGKDNDCPGCSHESEKVQRTSRRYLANAVIVDENSVVPLKLALDLANRLVARYERNPTKDKPEGTLLNRDYTLHRMGKGLDTTYDVTAEDKAPRDLSGYELIDLEQALIEQFEDAFDLDGDEDEDDGTQFPPPGAKPPRSEPNDDVPSEPSLDTDSDEDEGEEGELTEEQAMELDLDELKRLAEHYEVKIDGRWSKRKIVTALFEAAGE